jgi:hypothetical protein
MIAGMTGDGIVGTIAATIVGIAETIVGSVEKSRRAIVTDRTGE